MLIFKKEKSMARRKSTKSVSTTTSLTTLVCGENKAVLLKDNSGQYLKIETERDLLRASNEDSINRAVAYKLVDGDLFLGIPKKRYDSLIKGATNYQEERDAHPGCETNYFCEYCNTWVKEEAEVCSVCFRQVDNNS